MKTAFIFFISLLLIANFGLANNPDNLSADHTTVAQASNTASLQGERWSKVYSLREFGGGGCPFNAVGAIVPDPAKNRWILFEKGTDRYVYFQQQTRLWSGVKVISEMGRKGLIPFNSIGAAFNFKDSQGKDKTMFFDGNGTGYLSYWENPNPDRSPVYIFSNFGKTRNGGAPFKSVGATVPYISNNWLLLFEKDTDRYTYYDNDDREWVGPVYYLSQFGGGGCPFSSIGAAMPYRDDKLMLFDDKGENYVYYDEKGSLMLSLLRNLNGSIVVIKSHRWDGAYVKPDGNAARFGHIQRSTLLENKEIKLILHHVRDNIVCFESLNNRDHYLDMVHDRYVRFTLSYEIPKNKDWAQFSIHGNALDDVGIRSERGNQDLWFDAHQSGGLVGTYHASNTRPTDKWGKFAISFPLGEPEKQINEYWKILRRRENLDKEKDEPYEFKYTEKVEITKNSTTVNSAEISMELKANLGVPMYQSGSVSIGTKYSHSWSTSFETTSTTTKEDVFRGTLKPGEKVVIEQLTAQYGPYTVKGTIRIRKE